MSLIISALVASGLSATKPQKSATDSDIAAAVASLVKDEREVDVRYLGQVLKLPELLKPGRSRWSASAFDWSGPENGTYPNFAANYEPSQSTYGINRLTIIWQFGGVADGRATVFNALKLTFSQGHCPNEDRLTADLGIAPKPGFTPAYESGSSPLTLFFIPQSEGEAIQLSFPKGNTCDLSIMHVRPI